MVEHTTQLKCEHMFTFQGCSKTYYACFLSVFGWWVLLVLVVILAVGCVCGDLVMVKVAPSAAKANEVERKYEAQTMPAAEPEVEVYINE